MGVDKALYSLVKKVAAMDRLPVSVMHDTLEPWPRTFTNKRIIILV